MQILNRQRDKCAICKKPSSFNGVSLVVDHCHKTGTIRGLLCHMCNLMLGNASDDIKILLNGVTYLKSSGPTIYH